MQFFSSDKRLQEIFFKSPTPPSRVKWSAPNIKKSVTINPIRETIVNIRKSSGSIRNSPRHPHRVMLEIECRAAVTRNVFAACSAGRRVMAHDRYVELERHPLGGFGFSVIGGVDTHLPPMVCALVQNGSAQLSGRVSACVDDLCNCLQNHCMKAFIIQLALSFGTFEWLSSRDFVELFSLPGKITISERRITLLSNVAIKSWRRRETCELVN